MLGKIVSNYSPNFTTNKRIKKNIKYLVFHYTGMSSESKAIKRLLDENSKSKLPLFYKKKWSNYIDGARLIYCVACRNIELE